MISSKNISSWKKATKSIQQDGRKEMLRNDQASSWKQVMNSIQQNIGGMLKESNEFN